MWSLHMHRLYHTVTGVCRHNASVRFVAAITSHKHKETQNLGVDLIIYILTCVH